MNKNGQYPKSYPEEWTNLYFNDASGESLSAVTTISLLWAFAEKITTKGINLIITAIIARILVPEDFGLVSMAGLLMGIVALFQDYGLGAAIIYDKKVDQIDLSTVFWVGLAIGVFLCFIAILSGPLAVIYFKNAKVQGIIMVLSINFILGGLSGVHSTILTKRMQFKALAYINVISLLTQCLITFCLVVFFRAGYWGIVTGMICFSLTYSILVFLYTRWFPKPVFNIKRLKRMFNYGKNLFFERILNYFSSNIDYLIIGRILGASSLGIYFFAYTIPHTILTEFSQTITRVLFPVLCKVEDDPSRFQASYLKTIRYISLISFPAMIGLFCVAEPFIYVVFGEKYIAAVVPLKILCFSGMAKSILHSMGLVFNSKGRPDLGLKWNLCIFPVITIAVVIGSHLGLKGVSVAMMLTSYLSFIGAWISMRLAKISFLQYLKSLFPALVGSSLIIISLVPFNAYVFKDNNTSCSLITMVCIGCAVYFIYLLIFQKNTINEIVKLIKICGLR